MYTLDSTSFEIMADPRAASVIIPMCRSTVRVNRWGEQTMRELLSRPVQRVIIESCHLIKGTVWEDCSEELKETISSYLEKNNG